MLQCETTASASAVGGMFIWTAAPFPGNGLSRSFYTWTLLLGSLFDMRTRRAKLMKKAEDPLKKTQSFLVFFFPLYVVKERLCWLTILKLMWWEGEYVTNHWR